MSDTSLPVEYTKWSKTGSGSGLCPRKNVAKIPQVDSNGRERSSRGRSSCISSHRRMMRVPRSSTTTRHFVRLQEIWADEAHADNGLTSEHNSFRWRRVAKGDTRARTLCCYRSWLFTVISVRAPSTRIASLRRVARRGRRVLRDGARAHIRCW